MASFNFSPDLLSLNGAKVLTDLDPNHLDWPYVCIPVPLNPITLTTSKKDGNKLMAFLKLNMWPLSEKFKNAIRRSAQERGDSNAVIPTHEVCLNFSVDYIKSVAQKFPNLIAQVKEQNKAYDPDIVNQDPTDERSHLFKAIRIRLNKRLSLVNQMQLAQQPSPYNNISANVEKAVSSAAYVPSSEGSSQAGLDGSTFQADDLPF